MLNKNEILKQTISIYGMGNVGGSIAAVWLRAGATVIGVDLSKTLLNQIKTGTSHKKEPFLSETFTKSLKNGKLSVTTDGAEASKNSSIKIIVVPVGLKKDKADLDAVIKVTKNISLGSITPVFPILLITTTCKVYKV